MATIAIGTRRTDRGRFASSFQAVATEASVSHLFEFSSFAGDATAGNSFSCYVDYVQMSCNSAGRPHIKDGSAGSSLVGSQPPSDVTQQAYSQSWDFRSDPLVCLTAADNTSVLAVDMTVAGAYTGYIEYHIGPPPSA